MVTAGVYMVCRLSFLYVLSPEALTVVAGVGALTALFAATIGLVQNDIKGVLAYSTVSQLGFMFLAAGCGAFSAAIFHLVTHAFFKACLFLCSGSVIHGMEHAQHRAGVEGDPQDIRRMGGLLSKQPITAFTFGLSTLAIAGFPLTAGFFSKDEILWRALSSTTAGAPAWLAWAPVVLYAVGLTAALGTAVYMGRLFFRVFAGRCRAGEDVARGVHESPSTMTGPLVVLAGLAVFGGLLGVPHTFGEHLHLHVPNLIGGWLDPVFAASAGRIVARPEVEPAWEWGLTWLSAGIGVAGLGLAWLLWGGGREAVPGALARAFGPVYRLLLAKYRIDGLYDLVIVRPLLFSSRYFLDAFVDGVLIEKVMLGVPTNAARETGRLLRRWQTGNVQWYASALTLGTAVLLAIWWLGGGS